MIISSQKQTVSGFVGIYANGIDGDQLLTTQTLLRDYFFNNLTIPSGEVINTGGYRIFVKETLTLNGVITNSGNNANGVTPGSATALGTLGEGQAGSAQVPEPIDPVSFSNSAGGKGGSVLASDVVVPTDQNGGVEILKAIFFALTGTTNTLTRINGGSGGGPVVSLLPSGGGGGGGGPVVIVAKQIVGGGTISSNGGNGGNAPLGGNGDGGNGGGAGFVAVVTETDTDNLQNKVFVNGGSAGSGDGTGVAGFAGNSGRSFFVQTS